MNRSGKHWWHLRNEELTTLAQNQAPFYVYNEETLNEIFFDLSAMDALSGLFYPYHLNFHQPILQKAFELDAHFRCNSLLEVASLKEHFQKLAPGRIFLLSDHEHRKDCEAALHQGLHVAVRADNHGAVICPDSRFLSLCSQDEKISLFKTLSSQFPDISTLVLGNGANEESSAHMNGMDLTEIENYLEAIHDACPQFKLWLELPIHLVSYAGAMLMEALDHLLGLCSPGAYVILLGDTAPLAPVLFGYGVDAISGTKVVNPEQALRCVSQGANFRQIRGVKRLTIIR